MPLHSPHATQQSSLCFLQEHLRVSQSCLHVHLTTSRRASGAGGRSVIIGSRRFRTRSRHHSSGSRSSPFPIHCHTCKYTRVSAGSRLRGARGIYYPRSPFAADLQQLPLQRVQEKQWGQKYKLSRCERGYRMAVLTE